MIFNGNFSDTSYSKTLIIPIGQKFKGYTKLEHNSFGGLVLYLEKERCLIFIDHANVYQNIKPIGGRIDYVKFKEILSEGYHLVGAIIFLGLLEKVSKEQKKFFSFLRKSGYDTYFKRVQKTRSGKHKQKGIDTSIFSNVLKLAEEDTYDKAILVTGDGDFADLIGLLEHDNKKIIIWSFKKSLSHKLKVAAGSDNIHYIDDILDDIEFRTSRNL